MEISSNCDLSSNYQFAYLLLSGFPSLTILVYDSQSRTFTCTSTGGPATTVTWRRDGVVINSNETFQLTKRVVYPVWGTYQAVLTINSSVDQSDIFGSYNCTVENARGRSSVTRVVSDSGELISHVHCLLRLGWCIISYHCQLIIDWHSFTLSKIEWIPKWSTC